MSCFLKCLLLGTKSFLPQDGSTTSRLLPAEPEVLTLWLLALAAGGSRVDWQVWGLGRPRIWGRRACVGSGFQSCGGGSWSGTSPVLSAAGLEPPRAHRGALGLARRRGGLAQVGKDRPFCERLCLLLGENGVSQDTNSQSTLKMVISSRRSLVFGNRLRSPWMCRNRSHQGRRRIPSP